MREKKIGEVNYVKILPGKYNSVLSEVMKYTSITLDPQHWCWKRFNIY